MKELFEDRIRYCDYADLPKIRAFARRHGLRIGHINDPLEGQFLRIWFENPETLARAERLYGRSRGGWVARR